MIGSTELSDEDMAIIQAAKISGFEMREKAGLSRYPNRIYGDLETVIKLQKENDILQAQLKVLRKAISISIFQLNYYGFPEVTASYLNRAMGESNAIKDTGTSKEEIIGK